MTQRIRAAIFDLGVLAYHESDIVKTYDDILALKWIEKRDGTGTEHGYLLGVITSAPGDLADRIISEVQDRSGVRFNARVSRRQRNLPPKPDPAAHEACKKELGVGDWEAFYVGDETGNLIAAEKAKMYGILVARDTQVQVPTQYRQIGTLYELYSLEARL